MNQPVLKWLAICVAFTSTDSYNISDTISVSWFFKNCCIMTADLSRMTRAEHAVTEGLENQLQEHLLG